jgi:hypothetical protein
MTHRHLCSTAAVIIVVANVWVGCGAESAAPAASAQAPAAKADNRCPLTVEQVAAVTGAPMKDTGSCTFFPANGRDIPHVFHVLQIPMVCNSIKPTELGFKEPVSGLPAREAYVKDAIDGTHVLVCPNNGRGFDIVVDIKNDKKQNREAAIALAKQVLAGR